MNLIDIGHVVRQRRSMLGLSQGQLARLSHLSRQTLVGLENGTLTDLGVNRLAQILQVLGLDLPEPNIPVSPRKRGLWMAAKNASVSFARELEPDALGHMLTSGNVPAPFVPHVAHLLDETPIPIVVMAVEEAATNAHLPPKRIWHNVAMLAKSLSVHRQGLWE